MKNLKHDAGVLLAALGRGLLWAGARLNFRGTVWRLKAVSGGIDSVRADLRFDYTVKMNDGDEVCAGQDSPWDELGEKL